MESGNSSCLKKTWLYPGCWFYFPSGKAMGLKSKEWFPREICEIRGMFPREFRWERTARHAGGAWANTSDFHSHWLWLKETLADFPQLTAASFQLLRPSLPPPPTSHPTCSPSGNLDRPSHRTRDRHSWPPVRLLAVPGLCHLLFHWLKEKLAKNHNPTWDNETVLSMSVLVRLKPGSLSARTFMVFLPMNSNASSPPVKTLLPCRWGTGVAWD